MKCPKCEVNFKSKFLPRDKKTGKITCPKCRAKLDPETGEAEQPQEQKQEEQTDGR